MDHLLNQTLQALTLLNPTQQDLASGKAQPDSAGQEMVSPPVRTFLTLILVGWLISKGTSVLRQLLQLGRPMHKQPSSITLQLRAYNKWETVCLPLAPLHVESNLIEAVSIPLMEVTRPSPLASTFRVRWSGEIVLRVHGQGAGLQTKAAEVSTKLPSSVKIPAAERLRLNKFFRDQDSSMAVCLHNNSTGMAVQILQPQAFSRDSWV